MTDTFRFGLAAPWALGAGAARRRTQGRDPGEVDRERRDLQLPADPRGALGRRASG